MFEKASRIKLRFASSRGPLTVEDLWDLSLEELNTIAKALNKKLKEADEEDFLKGARKDRKLKLSFDLVIHILETKKAEVDKREKAAERRAKKAKLLELLERKQDAKLEDASEAKIKKMINELDDDEEDDE